MVKDYNRLYSRCVLFVAGVICATVNIYLKNNKASSLAAGWLYRPIPKYNSHVAGDFLPSKSEILTLQGMGLLNTVGDKMLPRLHI